VVGSATGGLVETIVDGVTGLAVPPGDAEALASALTRATSVATEPAAGSALRSAARSMAERHDVRRAAAASLAWYGTLRR